MTTRGKQLSVLWLGASLLAITMSCSRSSETADSREKVMIPDSVYIDQGNRLVAATFDTLRNSLMHAVQTQGFDGAITFCQVNAYPLTATYTDSVSLRRTALRVRNSSNAADSLERVVLEQMQAELSPAQPLAPKLVRSEGEIHFFKAIVLQPMCQNCHGSPGTDIQAATLSRIQTLYPNDQAVDYKAGDLRGAWHIVFHDTAE